MTLTHIGIFTIAACLGGFISHRRWRNHYKLILSVLAIYWLQSISPIRHLDFWLPTTTIAITVFTWIITSSNDSIDRKETGGALITITAVVISIALTRYVSPLCCITSTTPPLLTTVLLGLLAVTVIAVIISLVRTHTPTTAFLGSVFIVIIFLLLKTPRLTQALSVQLRAINNQPVELADVLDIQWLGFSYVAFRLLHTLRDRLTNRLPPVSLHEYVTYVIFFPAITAGPIERIQRFTQDLRTESRIDVRGFVIGARRILLGVFKKFVLADTLALFALNPSNASQISSTGWMWLFLYGYALRIYFDFSGYTDVAIGIAKMLGVDLSENFNRPYLKPNLTAFWNSWHITLAQWFRSYFFNPITRSLRSSRKKYPMAMIIFFAQLSTMTLIGLWHGVTWNFLLWGAWHGLGLFIHNRWAEARKSIEARSTPNPSAKPVLRLVSTLVTFNYVAIGWVWFALPTIDASLRTIRILIGLESL